MLSTRAGFSKCGARFLRLVLTRRRSQSLVALGIAGQERGATGLQPGERGCGACSTPAGVAGLGALVGVVGPRGLPCSDQRSGQGSGAAEDHGGVDHCQCE